MIPISSRAIRLRHSLNSCTLQSARVFLHGDSATTGGGQLAKDEPAIALPPLKRLAIVTCMDARINPFAQLGLREGDAHIIRNAGGMAKDALRSLVISQRLLGTREIAIYHHTGCGMVTFTTPSLRKLIKDADPTNAAIAERVESMEFLEFPDLEESVRQDVQFLRDCPLILPETKISGWVHDVKTGEASRIV